MEDLKDNSIDYNKKGTVFEIERYALKDGPGIRTVIFFKGCPLRCLWCANPESQSADNQLMYWETRCMGCKNCIDTCPNRALSWNGFSIRINRSACINCGKCTSVCNSEALDIAGKTISVSEVLDTINKDVSFYKQSGGGITFSGGEALTQIDFLYELAKACKSQSIHTCIETSGYSSWDNLKRILPFMDLFLFDIKTIDDESHKKNTGASNKLILSNFRKLIKSNANVCVRIPIIPGFNDSEGNIANTIGFLKKHGNTCPVSLLPYHTLGVAKYKKLDMDYKVADVPTPSLESINIIAEKFRKSGFYTTIGE